MLTLSFILRLEVKNRNATNVFDRILVVSKGKFENDVLRLFDPPPLSCVNLVLRDMWTLP